MAVINELHQLSDALKEAEITTEAWHRRYGPISNITKKAPCIRIVLDGDRVAELESLSPDKGENIRRYGDNQGSFPAMNLASLYRVTDEETKSTISSLIEHGSACEPETVAGWCTVNNWTQKFCKKYRQNFEARTAELLSSIKSEYDYPPLRDLIAATEPFKDPSVLHKALRERAFEMLQKHKDIPTALKMLFYLPSPKDTQSDDAAKLSVVLDTYDLDDSGISTVGPKFAKGLNRMLLLSEASSRNETELQQADAFGRLFAPIDEPMPKIKLAAGFDVSLRTMFKGQPCQYRYGRIESESYPISKEERTELGAALDWLGSKDRENKTWVSIGKGEAMYVFPSSLCGGDPELTPLYRGSYDPLEKEADFEARAKNFSEYVSKTKELDPENYPKWIHFFVLKKLDKARTKVVYNYSARPEEIVLRSDEWQTAAKNLPTFHFGSPWVPFPLKASGILNRVWKQDGTLASDKFKSVPAYYGMKLFFGRTELDRDLNILLRNAWPLALFAGGNRNMDPKKQLAPLKETLALMGMLLYWKEIRKDDYMNEYPYLFGQLLKAADELHELYCLKVREGQLPQQFVGSSMYQSAMELPRVAFAQLVQRISPYLAWAQTHRDAYGQVPKGNGEMRNTPNAGYYYNLFRTIADKLYPVLTDQTRFNDTEKAQLFIGYMASFPKKEAKNAADENQDDQTMRGESSNA